MVYLSGILIILISIQYAHRFFHESNFQRTVPYRTVPNRTEPCYTGYAKKKLNSWKNIRFAGLWKVDVCTVFSK